MSGPAHLALLASAGLAFCHGCHSDPQPIAEHEEVDEYEEYDAIGADAERVGCGAQYNSANRCTTLTEGDCEAERELLDACLAAHCSVHPDDRVCV